MSIVLRITDAGRAALVNAARDGTNAVRIASVGVTPTAIVAAANTAALPGEVKRIETISGAGVAADVIHLVVRDETADTYTVRSLALYLTDGTLFASYGQAAPIIEKSAGALLLLAIDATLLDVAASQITFGNANFLNPPATTTTAGVIELATDAEATALADAVRALTPKNMAAIFTAANVLSRLMSVDGAGSGLDADLLDGRQGAEFALWSGGNFTAPVGISHSGVAAGLRISDGTTGYGYMQFGNASDVNASLNWYMGSSADGAYSLHQGQFGFGQLRLRVTQTAVAFNGALMWTAANDGAGSGLDADLLDGRHATDFILRAGDNFTGPVGIRHAGLAAGLRVSDGTNGYGFIQFGEASDANVSLNWYMGSSADNAFSLYQGQFGFGQLRLRVTPTTVAFNGSLMWTTANDGAGSGLDADLLDGRQGGEFALLAGAAFTGPTTAPSGSIGSVTGDSNGNLLVGVSSGSAHVLAKGGAEGATHTGFLGPNGYIASFNVANASGQSEAPSAFYISKNSGTGRSINAAGTINASGADYAEYMQKADGCGPIAAGDVCGVDANGELVTSWSQALSFVVKSDQPGFVGNDTYGAHLGERPTEPTDETAHDFAFAYDAYVAELAAFEEALEAARANVDRIAFCGQVPVTVSGPFAVGDYVIATEESGGIEAVAIPSAKITFAQYRKRLGKVWAVRDGRAWIDVQHG